MSIELAANQLARSLASIVNADGPYEEKKQIVLSCVDPSDLEEFCSWFEEDFDDENIEDDDDEDIEDDIDDIEDDDDEDDIDDDLDDYEDDDEDDEDDEDEDDDEDDEDEDDEDLKLLHGENEEDLSPEEIKEALEELKKQNDKS